MTPEQKQYSVPLTKDRYFAALTFRGKGDPSKEIRDWFLEPSVPELVTAIAESVIKHAGLVAQYLKDGTVVLVVSKLKKQPTLEEIKASIKAKKKKNKLIPVVGDTLDVGDYWVDDWSATRLVAEALLDFFGEKP